MGPINVGQTATATIAPTANGVPDTNVSAVKFDVVPAGAYTIVQDPANPFVAVYTAVTPGTGFMATVTGVNEAGATLTDQQPLPDVNATTIADKLNLSVTTP